MLDQAAGRWKDKPSLAIRAGELPLPQRISDDWRQGNSPLAGFRLRLADRAVAVGAVPHMQFPLLAGGVGPAPGPKLPRPQTGEDRCQEDRPPPALGGLHNGLDLVSGRNVDADLELAFLAALCLPFDAAGASPPKITDDIARDKPALLRIAEQR